jgi:hypothetical protein
MISSSGWADSLYKIKLKKMGKFMFAIKKQSVYIGL